MTTKREKPAAEQPPADSWPGVLARLADLEKTVQDALVRVKESK